MNKPTPPTEAVMPPVPLSSVAIHLRPADNVAVAARNIAPGTEVEFDSRLLTVERRVGLGHKFAVRPIAAGEPVVKYGQTIGFAAAEISAGAHVHVHNVRADAFERNYAFGRDCPSEPVAYASGSDVRYWMGYDRGQERPEHLRYGTRNYVAIISTVNCSASTSKYVAERLRASGVLDRYPNVDGVVPIVHKQGCAMQYGGPDHRQLDRTLAGFARHPNVGAYILIGLGCETGQATHLIEGEQLIRLDGSHVPPPVLSIQECGGIAKTVEAGVRAVGEMLPRVNDVSRERLPARHLVLGTNCGGSDGNSGVTANPALGVASDLLVRQGGTSILGETPEIYVDTASRIGRTTPLQQTPRRITTPRGGPA